MPFKDPEKQRAYRREWMRRKYQEDAEFREKEAERKAAWYADPENNEKRKKAMREYGAKKRESEE